MIAAAVVAALVGIGALGLWWWLRVPTLDYDTPEAIALFARVLNGEHDQQDRAISALAGAIDAHPGDARAHLWFGLANMHAFIGNDELPYAIRATRALDRAVELDPSDTSAAGWRAFWRFQVADNRGDDLAGPRRELLDAAEGDPRFTPFLVAVAMADEPLDSGWPQRALPPLEAIEDCGDGTASSCRTGHLFPHGTEGFHATLGDLKVRLGDVEGGRAQYARARALPTYADWPYRDAFEAWTEGADERARRLTNDDPGDDPTIFFASGDRACAACHEASSSGS